MFHRMKSLIHYVSGNSDALIKQHQERLTHASEHELKDESHEIRDQLLAGISESKLIVPTFALVREATRRCLGVEHRPNQLQAAVNLLSRKVIEMPTGEGKTLAATPALALRALMGRGVWLATANDYLARRDATLMRPVFELLGISIGYVQAPQSPAERRSAYHSDITYGTIREFGFDFLRDRLAIRRRLQTQEDENTVQRERYSILVDEADSILLDDARTPLIISESATSHERNQLFRWSVQAGRQLVTSHDYFVEPETGKIWISDHGRARIRELSNPDVLKHFTLPETYESVGRAIEAEQSFHLNRDYVIRDGKIVIVDRLTGRLAEGRQWQNGFQQSLEAANDLEITAKTNPSAKITVQAFLKGFQFLSGMTGTAAEARREFKQFYSLQNCVISPFRPCQRIEQPAVVVRSRAEKWAAVVAAARKSQAAGRPVLIGTRDLNASHELSAELAENQIEHQLLTAQQEAEEAELVSRAGQAGTVTVSTSIAGRGTDIQLGDGIADRGGLHVIAADLFDSSRIDRQLAGRGGRQGDPATYQKILSLEDEILFSAWELEQADQNIRSVLLSGMDQRLALLKSAQAQIERRHYEARRDLNRRDQMQSKRHQELGFDPYLDDVES